MLLKIFENSVARYPSRPCLQFENEVALTYQEVDQAANQLAQAFLAHGIKPKDFVAFRAERSTEQTLVFLALLKINAVYVPISTEQSTARLKLILSGCKVKHLISSHPLPKDEQIICKTISTSIFCLADMQQIIASHSVKKPAIQGSESDLIYVIHSSGTTGPSKAIPINNSGMQGYWEPELRRQLRHPVTRVLAALSIDFDAHIWEYLMAWIFGASLHLTNEYTRKDAGKLAEFISEHAITDMTLTPALLRMFSNEQVQDFASKGLKAIYSTGEACTQDIIQRYAKFAIKIYNCYGPTEATFGLSMTLCDLDNFHEGMAPIGLPPADSRVQIKIIDSIGKPVKENQLGELVIVSPYLSPGYIGQSSDKFMPVKEAKQSGLVEYRTGDMFKQNKGLLYFSGRFDPYFSQLKIRGQLVNPTGVEEVLRQHKHIKDACVLVKSELLSKGQDFLVAFIVATQEITTKELRKYCKDAALSLAAIPTFFSFMDKLPTNASGKVDRDHLSTERLFKRDKSTPYLPPIKTIEKQLTTIWKDVLGLENLLPGFKVGLEDSFALFGGNSINVMLLLAEVNKHFQATIGLDEFFNLEDLTVAKLSEKIYKTLLKTANHASFQTLKKGGYPPLFLLPPITGESFFTYQKFSQNIKTDCCLCAINAPSLINPFLEFTSIPELARQLIYLINEIQPNGNFLLAGWSSGGLLAYEICQQLEAAGRRVDLLCIIDELAPELQNAMSQTEFAQELYDLLSHLSDIYKFELTIDPRKLGLLPKIEQIGQGFDSIFQQSLSSVIRANLVYAQNFLLAQLDYLPKKLQSTPITVFSTATTRQKIKAGPDLMKVSTLGWKDNTKLYASILEVTGDHFSILDKEELAENITACLQRLPYQVSAATDQLTLSDITQQLTRIAAALKPMSTSGLSMGFFSSQEEPKALAAPTIALNPWPPVALKSRL